MPMSTRRLVRVPERLAECETLGLIDRSGLRELMERSGITQVELAAALGVTQPVVARWLGSPPGRQEVLAARIVAAVGELAANRARPKTHAKR